MYRVVVLDAGNAIIKAKSASSEVSFRHALVQLSETEYEHVLKRTGGKPPIDYLCVNGVPFVVGDKAESHGHRRSVRSGAARYTADYYGVLMAAALVRLYDSSQEIYLYGSHPPRDITYRDSLMDAVMFDWEIEHGKRKYRFAVDHVNTFEEPVGGLMNVVLAEDGQHYKNGRVQEGTALVIDVGGVTTDFIGVDPGGQINLGLDFSENIGINETIQSFELALRDRYRDEFRNSAVFVPERLRNAIATGIFEGGGKQYPCQEEVAQAISGLINRIHSTYQNRAGGPTPFDTIVLTGGGSAMLYTYLQDILDHANVMLAEDLSTAHLANVRGGMKLWRLLESMNAI